MLICAVLQTVLLRLVQVSSHCCLVCTPICCTLTHPPTHPPSPPSQVLYHGPREGVMPFFRAHLGFDCPLRKGVADFLQEIALPSDQQASWEMAMDG